MRSWKLIEQCSHVVAANTFAMSTFPPNLATLIGNLNTRIDLVTTEQKHKINMLKTLLQADEIILVRKMLHKGTDEITYSGLRKDFTL